jgi:ribosomal-protein-alanine N-acetyltransferase
VSIGPAFSRFSAAFEPFALQSTESAAVPAPALIWAQVESEFDCNNQRTVSTVPLAVTTRLFQDPDLRALYAIEEACFESSVRFSRALMRSLAYHANCRTWLGMVDHVRVGFAVVGLQSDEDPTAAYVWTIEVLPGFRRMGVARQLLVRVEESAREAGCVAVELHVSERNTDGLALYEGAGYFRTRVDGEYYGRGEDAFRYRKQLPR